MPINMPALVTSLHTAVGTNLGRREDCFFLGYQRLVLARLFVLERSDLVTLI